VARHLNGVRTSKSNERAKSSAGFYEGIHIAITEQGKRDSSYTTLLKLASYFNVGLNALC